MAPMHTITRVTDLTTLQELATVSKAAENYLNNSLGKMWPALKGSTMTLGKFYHLSPATASNFRREATAYLAKATTKTSTISKNKAISILLKRTSSSLKRVSPKLTSTFLKRISPKLTSTSLKRASTKDKRLTPRRKRAPTFKYALAEIEGHSTVMIATNSTKDVSMSTEDLVATQEESTMTEDTNILKKPTSSEINPALSGISLPIAVLSSNQHPQGRLPHEKKDSHLMAPEVTLSSRKAPVLIDITSSDNSSLTSKKQHEVPETTLSSRMATPVLIDLTSSTNIPLSVNKQHDTDKSSSTVTAVRNVGPVRSGLALAPVVPTVSRADKEPKLPEKSQPRTMFIRATLTVPTTTESPARKAWIAAELKRHEQDKTSPYQQATSDIIKRDAKAGLRKEFISYKNHTIATEAIREQTTAAKRKRETDGDSDDKAMTTNTQNKKRKGLVTMHPKVIAVSVLGLAVALSTAPANVSDWISTSIQMDFDVLPPLRHYLPTAFSTPPLTIRDWFSSIPLDGIVLPLRHHFQVSAPSGVSDWLSSTSALLEENMLPSPRCYLQPPAARLLDWPRWPTCKDPRA